MVSDPEPAAFSKIVMDVSDTSMEELQLISLMNVKR
jgi:hypothetical protein